MAEKEPGSRTYVLEMINEAARLGNRATYIVLASPSTYGNTVLELQLFNILASVPYYDKGYSPSSMTIFHVQFWTGIAMHIFLGLVLALPHLASTIAAIPSLSGHIHSKRIKCVLEQILLGYHRVYPIFIESLGGACL